MQVDATFHAILGAQLLECAYSGHAPGGGWSQGLPAKNENGARLYLIPDAAESDVLNYLALSPHFPGYAQAFDMYEDMDSSYLMTLLVAFRIMGPSRVRLSITPESYEKAMRDFADPLLVEPRTHTVDFPALVLDHYNMASAGIPLQLHTTRSALTAHCHLEQYAFRRRGVVVTVEPGDTVIDGGMCYGDTSLFFAHLAGESGRVVGYEFEPGNLAIMADNFALNPGHAPRITVRHNAVWNVSGDEPRFALAGPATTVLHPGSETQLASMVVKTLTIDDLVAEEGLDRVDFIKLDVEGVELQALQGAVDTLRRFRPKLALSAYHKPEDMYALPGFLRSLDLGYRFWLDHFRPGGQETVIFAACR